jgi:tRNA (guanosine-2'-O-)-methyltransferase
MTPERFEKLKTALDRRQPDLTVLMDNIHKDHNLGAVLRSADAVGVLEMHAVSRHGEVKRHRMMSGGSRKWISTHVHPDMATAAAGLRDRGFRIVAAHFSGLARDFREADYTLPTALLLGSELRGVSAQGAALADEHVIIPMVGMVGSLNVSVAAAIILYEAQRQRETAGMYARSRLDPATRRRLLFEWAYPEIARHCRERGLPYPALDAQGYLVAAVGKRGSGTA